MANSGRRSLLLTFDAFGTLFSPRGTVAQQYVNVAKQFGMKGLAVSEIDDRFKKGKIISALN